MSSPKRQAVCTSSHDGTTAVEPPPPIPVDLLLDILARVDVATVVRCAATSKAVRRAILGDPTIGRRVAANNSGAVLLGVSYAISEYDVLNYREIRTRGSFVGQAPQQNQLGFDAGRKLKVSEPVASRGGLIVLRQRRYSCSCSPYLLVWNAIRRSILVLPPAAAALATATGYGYPHALLTVGDAGRSFQLLVVSSGPSLSLRTQICSKSKDDDGSGRWRPWGPVTEITDLPPELKLPLSAPSRRRPEALVLGGGTAVHWLHKNNDSGRCIVRIAIDKAKATLIALPPQCVHRSVGDGELQLAASTDGKLSLVVAERCGVISMWTLLSAAAAPGEGGSATWTRQVVISREAIARVPIPTGRRCKDLFLGFGELSSTVVLLMEQVGLVRINLRTKEALILGSDDEFKETEASHGHGHGHVWKKIEACLHEIDLSSLLLVMKP